MILLNYIISKQLVCVLLIIIIKVIYTNEHHLFSFILPSNPILKLKASSKPPVNSFAHISTLRFTIITKLSRMVVESNIS